MKLNAVPDEIQPTEAILAIFAGPDATAVEKLFVEAGISTDRLWMWVGDEGRDAYDRRGSAVVRFFDDTKERVDGAFEAGHLVVVIQGIEESDSSAVQQIANDGGAVDTLYFGETTHKI